MPVVAGLSSPLAGRFPSLRACGPRKLFQNGGNSILLPTIARNGAQTRAAFMKSAGAVRRNLPSGAGQGASLQLHRAGEHGGCRVCRCGNGFRVLGGFPLSGRRTSQRGQSSAVGAKSLRNRGSLGGETVVASRADKGGRVNTVTNVSRCHSPIHSHSEPLASSDCVHRNSNRSETGSHAALVSGVALGPILSSLAAVLVCFSSILPAQAFESAPPQSRHAEEITSSEEHSPVPFRSTSGYSSISGGSVPPLSTPSLVNESPFSTNSAHIAPFIAADSRQTVSSSFNHSFDSQDSNTLSNVRIRNLVSSAGEATGIGSECPSKTAGKLIAVGNPVEKSQPAASPDLDPEVNANLILEAWNVVDQVYLDARGKGFDRDAWAAKRDEALKHPIRSRIAAYSTIRSLLGSLNDPYTRFLAPDQFQALSKFDVSGIGLNIGEVDDDSGMTSLRVLGVVHDSSAHAAGIRQGDELLSVGGTSVKGKSAFEATSLIQGPVGQPVTLQLQNPTGEAFEVVVPRGKEAQQPVSYKLERDAEGRLAGYVKLRDFSALAKKGVVEAILKLRDAGAQSFVLDLQDNLGGLVQAGIEIARLFLDEGETVVYTEGRTPDTQKNVLVQAPAVFSAPLIVLVNENTASASEIVAGALHDNCRALLVGNRTYGKGLIQSVYELTDGSALAITVGKYITPGHIDIDKYGIEPDFIRTPGPFNWFLPLPSVKDIESKLKSCVPPEVDRRKAALTAAAGGA